MPDAYDYRTMNAIEEYLGLTAGENEYPEDWSGTQYDDSYNEMRSEEVYW